jgi:asparagine synthase (glutamine-hydrolysing)
MCGIAAVFDVRRFEPVDRKVLSRMADAISHRGPDGAGLNFHRNLGMAHRRLAVIDPTAAGAQPMSTTDSKLTVCYNGTIYNFLELKTQLARLGHTFRSNCDTEVLLHGFEQWGEDMVENLNGHFAFVLYDSTRHKAYLVRDRYGTKPLYYANMGGLWIIGSEIKAILAHPAYRFSVNYEALNEYFTFQNLFRFHTLFEGVYLLPPANILTIDLSHGATSRRSYWDYDFTNRDEKMTACDAKNETRRLMEEAVRRQLYADVPLGAYLSGGMDSGSIVSIAAQQIERMHTFTCGWQLGEVDGIESTFDERVQAERMASIFGTQHFEQVVGHHDIQWVLEEVVNHLEDLRLGMCYGNYYVARLASKFVKVCLSGAGGDELFGGYPWRYYRFSKVSNQEQFFDHYYDYWQRLVSGSDRKNFFEASAAKRIEGGDLKEVLKRVFTFNDHLVYATPEDHIANSMYFEAKTFLHGLLIVNDRLSMAHGLEERFPFLDNELCNFAQKIPVRHKLKDLEKWKSVDENNLFKQKQYYAEHNDGKNVLRQAMEQIIPEEVLNRKKQGFSSPDGSWYRGPIMAFVKEQLLSKGSLCQEYISRERIKKIILEHCQGANRRLLIWSLLCFETWLKIFAAPTTKLLDRPCHLALVHKTHPTKAAFTEARISAGS